MHGRPHTSHKLGRVVLLLSFTFYADLCWSVNHVRYKLPLCTDCNARQCDAYVIMSYTIKNINRIHSHGIYTI